MIYQTIVNTCRSAATSANPSGRFIHGRIIDASRSYDGAYPLIVLYPFTVRVADVDDQMDNSDIVIGFWMQDSPDSSPEKREDIINTMDALSDIFIQKLKDTKKIAISGIVKEPQYQFYAGTVSGFAIRFTFSAFSDCDPIQTLNDYEQQDYSGGDYVVN